MGAMQAQPAKQPSPLFKKAQKIKGQIDNLISKMHKEPNYTPTQDLLDGYAESIIDFINDNHVKTAPYESYLKAAIIDLTEVPQMAPQMQRIAFLTALKDASKELDFYLGCC